MRLSLILLLVLALYGSFTRDAGFVYEDLNGVEDAITVPWAGTWNELALLCHTDPADSRWQDWATCPLRGRRIVTFSNRLNALGQTAWVYHLTNLLLHLAVVLGLYGLLASVRSDVAWLGAGLLALHPLATEAVAYISGRSELVAAAGTLVALVGATTYRNVWMLAGVWLAFQGSELTALALVLALPIAAWRLQHATWPVWRLSLALLTVGLLVAWCRPPSVGELTVLGSTWSFIGQQVGHGVRLLAQLLVPLHQSIELPAVDARGVWAALGVLISGSLLAWTARRDYPGLAAAWAWGVTILLPRMLIPRFEGLHERHAYAALLGCIWCAMPRHQQCAISVT